MLPGKKISQISAARAGVGSYMDATLPCSRILSLSTAFKFIRKKKICRPAAVSVLHKKSCTLRILAHAPYFCSDGRQIPLRGYINTALLFCPLNLLFFLDLLDAVGVTYVMNRRKAALICAEIQRGRELKAKIR